MKQRKKGGEGMKEHIKWIGVIAITVCLTSLSWIGYGILTAEEDKPLGDPIPFDVRFVDCEPYCNYLPRTRHISTNVTLIVNDSDVPVGLNTSNFSLKFEVNFKEGYVSDVWRPIIYTDVSPDAYVYPHGFAPGYTTVIYNTTINFATTDMLNDIISSNFSSYVGCTGYWHINIGDYRIKYVYSFAIVVTKEVKE